MKDGRKRRIMKKEEFAKFVKDNKVTILDGATGTLLAAHGMPLSASESLWVFEHPEITKEIKKAYLDAGSQIIYAPTFSANREKLKQFGLEKDIEKLNRTAVEITRDAVGGKALVAGDIGMSGVMLEPYGDYEYEDLVEVYKEQMEIIKNAGCDLFVIETMMNIEETEAALEACAAVCDLPVMVTMTFEGNGRTLYGATPEDAAKALAAKGADAIGANCSTGPDKMLGVIEKLAAVSEVPVIAKPNAGLPVPLADGNVRYDVKPEEFVCEMKKIIEAGATIVGGCCGTTPEYIKALVSAVR